MEISMKYDIPILAGLVEKEGDRFYNSYICVYENELIAKFRKLHPFISKYLSPGNEYVTFDLFGWKCGMLICYDNNIIENVRATALLGADIIFAPHVTCCTPSAMPGRGYVDDSLWQNRATDPQALRKEFDGPKGREWLMRWLPARAYDNGVYYVYSQPHRL
jgi:predicted amidohydrolase